MSGFGSFTPFEGFSESQKPRTTPSPRNTFIPSGGNVVDRTVHEAVAKKVGPPIQTYESRVKPIRYAGLVLGSLYHIEYLNYQHDPKPLALILNRFDTVHGNFRAFNLHYVPLKAQMDIILRILYINGGAIKNGKPLVITYDVLKPLFRHRADYVPFRNYKPYFVRNARYVPVSNWVNTVKNSRTVLPG